MLFKVFLHGDTISGILKFNLFFMCYFSSSSQKVFEEDTVIVILNVRKLRIRESGRPGVRGNLAKTRELINALNLGTCESTFHGEIREVEEKRSQPTSHTLLLIT